MIIVVSQTRSRYQSSSGYLEVKNTTWRRLRSRGRWRERDFWSRLALASRESRFRFVLDWKLLEINAHRIAREAFCSRVKNYSRFCVYSASVPSGVAHAEIKISRVKGRKRFIENTGYPRTPIVQYFNSVFRILSGVENSTAEVSREVNFIAFSNF